MREVRISISEDYDPEESWIKSNLRISLYPMASVNRELPPRFHMLAAFLASIANRAKPALLILHFYD